MDYISIEIGESDFVRTLRIEELPFQGAIILENETVVCPCCLDRKTKFLIQAVVCAMSLLWPTKPRIFWPASYKGHRNFEDWAAGPGTPEHCFVDATVEVEQPDGGRYLRGVEENRAAFRAAIRSSAHDAELRAESLGSMRRVLSRL